MMRPALRATLCLAALAAACPCVLAQTSPAPAANPAPDTTAHTPDVTLSATYAEALPLTDQIAAILAAPNVARDHWGIQVTTLDGTPIYSLNEAQLFQPASNAKLFTTAAALALLNPQKPSAKSHGVFQTEVVGKGIFNGAKSLKGDVVLIGDGDANISGRALPYFPPSVRPKQASVTPDPLRYLADMADQVAATGLKSVKGDIVGDDTLFPWEPYAVDWSIDDMVWGYGAPVSALSINDNQIDVTVVPGPTEGSPATVSINPTLPYYTLDTSSLKTGARKSESRVEFEREPGSKTLRIYGSIATDAKPDVEEVAIADPAEYSALAFKEMLVSRGINVSGVARAQHRESLNTEGFIAETHVPIDDIMNALQVSRLHGQRWRESGVLKVCAGCEGSFPPGPKDPIEKVLASHTSPALSEDVVLTNKVSQNLHAELFLHQLGAIVGSDGSTAQGARVVRAFLINAGLDPNDFVFYDGSGLSGHDLVTPRATAKLLAYAAHDPKTSAPQPWFAVWKSSLPVGGEDGTLASRFANPPLKDHLFAKTGTLGEARALSGYLDAASGRTIIFSIFVGNHLPGTSDDRDAMDKIVAAIQAAE